MGTIECPHPFIIKANASDIYCDGVQCELPRDGDLCCDSAELCTGLNCPLGYVPVMDILSTYCNTTVCDHDVDRDTCCDEAEDCATHFTCPTGYVAKSPPAYCGAGSVGG